MLQSNLLFLASKTWHQIEWAAKSDKNQGSAFKLKLEDAGKVSWFRRIARHSRNPTWHVGYSLAAQIEAQMFAVPSQFRAHANLQSERSIVCLVSQAAACVSEAHKLLVQSFPSAQVLLPL